MNRAAGFIVMATELALASCGGSSNAPTSPQGTSAMTFFVTSAKSTTGNLGGLLAADALCQRLAEAAGSTNKTWRAYLSVERDLDNQPTDARNRVGNGPWVNAAGVVVAHDLTELHARKGDASVFVDERGQRIPGQW